jgi:hypothetical protein
MTLSRRSLLCAAVLLALGVSAFPARAGKVVIDLPLRHARLPEDKQLVRVTQGDVVTLRWTTDRPVVLHLHGYDIEKKIEPGIVAEMTFTARATGRFPVNLHAAGTKDSELSVLYVEVYPR